MGSFTEVGLNAVINALLWTGYKSDAYFMRVIDGVLRCRVLFENRLVFAALEKVSLLNI